MKLVFMGTPAFAAVSLQRLLESEHQVLGVVTQPDRPRGRGMEIISFPGEEGGTPQQPPPFPTGTFTGPGLHGLFRKDRTGFDCCGGLWIKDSTGAT